MLNGNITQNVLLNHFCACTLLMQTEKCFQSHNITTHIYAYKHTQTHTHAQNLHNVLGVHETKIGSTIEWNSAEQTNRTVLWYNAVIVDIPGTLRCCGIL